MMQKTASLYFCTPEKLFAERCKKPLRSIFALRKSFLQNDAKNRFALFLHSGKDLMMMRDDAKNRFALFLHSGKVFCRTMQKTASLYFCTPEKLFDAG
ncbi:hypothetical protein [Desulfonema magnum]|uniref:Uncharacterized protein n=1 Tax=Desulfonema magnum TaxID=45655 RepID=A0A975GP98_9BACT|nr:hypothetical protein [Desulfonema magnum]QTA88617.1 Uncharacterized protein dnm_046640 [Desulfonema magnum]